MFDPPTDTPADTSDSGTANCSAPNRRRVLAGLLGLGGLALAGCVAGSPTTEERPGTTPPTSTGAPVPTATPTSTVVLPEPADWTPLPGEVEPACKLAAVQAAVSALTVTSGTPPEVPPALAPLSRMVSGVERSVLTVVYPQYGGLTADKQLGCVILVGELVSVTPGAAAASTVSVNLDIRLRKVKGAWHVTDVLVPQARHAPAAPPAPVAALLDHPNVVFPREAQVDLITGEIDARLVALLTGLSEDFRMDVAVLKAGHPHNVFATNRISNHTQGRAVDVWSLDGVPVIEQDRVPWREFMREAAALGANSIGGPTSLGGKRGGTFFTDHVHQDHIHVAFNDRKPYPTRRG